MITYLAINVSNGNYYWGSTVSLKKREKAHRKSKVIDYFHNSLRSDPESWVFVEVWDEEDPNRLREQQMLNLHHGREGCLNVSSLSGGGKIPGSGWGHGEDNIAKRPEIREKISKATRGKPHNLKPEFRKPWANAMANKEIWAKADSLHEVWSLLNKPGDGKLASMLGIKRGFIRKMIKYFREGWVPSQDKDWLLTFRSE